MRIQVTGGSFGGAIDRDTVERLSGLFEVKVLQSLYYPNATWTMGGDTRTIMVFGFLGKAGMAIGSHSMGLCRRRGSAHTPARCHSRCIRRSRCTRAHNRARSHA